jgi:hypothetical protein
MTWNEFNDLLIKALPYTTILFIGLTAFIEYRKYKKSKNGK